MERKLALRIFRGWADVLVWQRGVMIGRAHIERFQDSRHYFLGTISIAAGDLALSALFELANASSDLRQTDA
jgi:hypothetical protein